MSFRKGKATKAVASGEEGSDRKPVAIDPVHDRPVGHKVFTRGATVKTTRWFDRSTEVIDGTTGGTGP